MPIPAAIVMVMISSGIFIRPIKPKTDDDAMMLGITAMIANLMDRNKQKHHHDCCKDKANGQNLRSD